MAASSIRAWTQVPYSCLRQRDTNRFATPEGDFIFIPKEELV